MQEEEKIPLTRKTVTTTSNDLPAPKVEQIAPDNTPFQYTPGTSVTDLLRQGQVQQKTLVDQEARTKKLMKIQAFADLFKSLGGLAGDGYANVQQQQTSPQLLRAFGEVDRIRQDKIKSEQYYAEAARRAQKDDYTTQLTAFNKERDRRFQTDRFNAAEANKASMQQYKDGGSKVQDVYQDRTLDERRANTAAYQAQTARMRAEATQNKTGKMTEKEKKEQENSEVVFTINKEDGSKQSLTKGRALALVDRVEKDLKEKVQAKRGVITPQEVAIMNALKGAKVDKKTLTKAIDIIRQHDKTNQYGDYWLQEKGEPQRKSMLPQSNKPATQQQQAPRKSLLP